MLSVIITNLDCHLWNINSQLEPRTLALSSQQVGGAIDHHLHKIWIRHWALHSNWVIYDRLSAMWFAHQHIFIPKPADIIVIILERRMKRRDDLLIGAISYWSSHQALNIARLCDTRQFAGRELLSFQVVCVGPDQPTEQPAF